MEPAPRQRVTRVKPYDPQPSVDAYARRVQVDVVRLDDVIAEPVGFIKIDVEGHELAVLEGAERILREHRPVLLVEATPTNNPATPRDVMDFLALRGYTGFFLFKNVMTPLSAFRANVHQELLPDGRMGPNHVFNFMFLPAPAP